MQERLSSRKSDVKDFLAIGEANQQLEDDELVLINIDWTEGFNLQGSRARKY